MYQILSLVIVAITSLGPFFGTANYIGNGYWITAKHIVDNSNSLSIEKNIVYVVKEGKNDVDKDWASDWAVVKEENENRKENVCVDTEEEYIVGKKYKRIGYDKGKRTEEIITYIGRKGDILYFRGLSFPGASGGGIYDEDNCIVAILTRGNSLIMLEVSLDLKKEMFEFSL